MKVYVLLITSRGGNGDYTDCIVFDSKKKAQDKMTSLFYELYDKSNKSESYCGVNSGFILLNDEDKKFEIEEKEIN